MLRELYRLRLVWIDDWPLRKNGGACYPTYTWGIDQQDVSKPKPLSKRVLWQRWNKALASRERDAKLLGLLAGKKTPTHNQRAYAPID